MTIAGRTATASESSSATSETATLPSDIVSGDYVVAFFSVPGTSTGQFTGPGGSWVEIMAPATVADNNIIAAYGMFDPGSSPSASTSASAGKTAATCQAYGGVDTTTPLDTSVSTTVTSPYGTSITLSGVTTTLANARLVSGAILDSSNADWSSIPSGMTQQASTTTGGVGRGMTLADEVITSAGGTGDKTWTAPASLGLGGFMVALRPATVDFTGSLSLTDSLSGDLFTGFTGSLMETASLSGDLNLTAGAQGSLAATASLSGGVTVISRQFTCALEIEFTAGTWTDVTDYLDLGQSTLTIRQGRATPYDQISPGVMTFTLWNDDGRWIPNNAAGTYYPNWTKNVRVRWRVTKSGTTYTRFVGWVQSIQPEYPGSTLNGAKVAVSAIDALGLLARRIMRSNFTEISLWRASNDAVAIDVWEGSAGTTGNVALLTNYSLDSAAESGYYYWSTTASNLSFSSDDDVSIGIVAVGSGDFSSKTIANFQSTPLQLILHIKCPSSQVSAASTYYVCSSFHTAINGGAQYCHLALIQNGSGGNDMVLTNAAASSTLFSFGAAPFGQWVKIYTRTNGTTATHSDWVMVSQDATTGITYSDLSSIDISTIRAIEFPEATGLSATCSAGGFMGIGTRTVISDYESFTGATWGTLSSRVTSLGTILAQGGLPVSFTTSGTLSSNVATGKWSGRNALDVLTEMLATYSGLAWARSRDSEVYCIGSDNLYPTTVIASVDVDGDCEGSPRLVDGSESDPTRVDVTFPGGSTTYVDTTAEASGISSSRSLSTVALTASVALAAGQELVSRLNGELRISQVTVDLIRGATDHTAALFSESGGLTGLFPSARIRLYLPSSHFGVASHDVHVQGWTESYAYEAVTVALDTSPATSSSIASETWTGSNGSAWPAQWVEGSTGSGATVDIQSNRGRIIVGAGDFTARRLDISTDSDVDVTCLINAGTGGECGVFWHETGTTGDTSCLQAGVDGSNLVVWRVTSSTYSSVYAGGTFSAGTDYYIRVRHQGTVCQVKCWAAAGSEPGSWDTEFTEQIFIGPGYNGVYGYASTTTHTFDNYTLNTGA